jgi:hypothetical protein
VGERRGDARRAGASYSDLIGDVGDVGDGEILAETKKRGNEASAVSPFFSSFLFSFLRYLHIPKIPNISNISNIPNIPNIPNILIISRIPTISQRL